jgi:hypothetical protein
MEKSDYVFVLLSAPIDQLKSPDNPVTKYINGSQVKSVLDLQLFLAHPQFGMGPLVFAGLLYERVLPEEQQPREPKKEAGKGQPFQKRPKPLPLR